MKDLMVDLETFGNGKNACIVQIGACYFSRHTGAIGETFKINVDARSSVKTGAEMDADTVYWWLSQSREAIDSITETANGRLSDLHFAMGEFSGFASKAENIWSHATFDFVILQETYKRLGVKPSFSHRAARDIRTLMDLSGVDAKALPRSGTHHDALDDCLHQVKYCCQAFHKIYLKEPPK